ncbi:DUF11 domain-containing protein, partial [Oscillochloris sp. ZM17-4]|nr:DUF11 domain-containing protein [Oscillochloris sp. ZM17-4]
MMPFRPASGRVFRLAFIALLLIIAMPGGAIAIESPPAGLQTYLQTNGPTSDIGKGDWYTSDANGVLAGYHYHEITVPCGWPATLPVYIDLFSPEMVVAAVGDEVRPMENLANANATFFELYDVGTVIGPGPNQPAAGAAGSILSELYPPLATGEAWRRFATLAAPVTCGTYVLRAETLVDDENSWRVRVGTDDDSDPDNVPPANYDNPDGLPGTDDEIMIGVRTGSYQNDVTTLSVGFPIADQCLTLYEYVKPGSTSVAFNNFDLDYPGLDAEILYYPPSAAYDPAAPQSGGISYTPSGGTVWNTSATVNRGTGDVFPNATLPILESGWWKIVTCANGNNQYIQEGQTNSSAYYVQPPIPAMEVSKGDGVDLVSPGDQLSYTIIYTNTSSGATAGAATSVVLTDTIPANTTYVDCVIPPAEGSCSESGGKVTFILAHSVKAGQSGSVQVIVTVSPTAAGGDTVVNTVTLDYNDSLGNPYPPQSDTDTDTVQVNPVLPVLTVAKDDGVAAVSAGDSLTYAIRYENVTTGAPARPATNVVLRDTIPSNTSYVSCVIAPPATGICGEAGGVVTFTISGSIAAGESGLVQVTVTVDAGAGGTVENTVTLDYEDDAGNSRPQRSATDIDQLPAPDLRLLKSADSALVTAGQLITYTLAYFNDSPATASGVQIDE